MKTTQSYRLFAISVLALSTFRLDAVEGGLGRPISGASINPFAGVIPPAPGFAVEVGEMYYDGSIHGSQTVPVNLNLTVGLDLNVSFTPVSALYIWNTGTNSHWNFASALSLPITWLEAQADVKVGPRTGHVKDSEFGLFDLLVTPIVASYHITPTDHFAFDFSFWAPSGEYDPKQLANLSLNNWTFIPGVAYTKIIPEDNIELSASWQLQFYTENPDTDYQNGVLSDFEFLAIKRFKCGAGAGFVGSWIQQLNDDTGGNADKINGFLGHAFGIGPIFTYSTEIAKHHLDLSARWINEIETKNRVEGNLFMFTATFKF